MDKCSKLLNTLVRDVAKNCLKRGYHRFNKIVALKYKDMG